MNCPVQTPLVGEYAVYQGTFCPHWEMAHIEVRVSRIRKLIVGGVIGSSVAAMFGFGLLNGFLLCAVGGLTSLYVLLPATERWSFELQHGLDDLVGGPIEFEGKVSARGSFGHMDMMHRMVVIRRVLNYCHGRQSII